MDQKIKICALLPTGDSLQIERHRTKVKRWKKILYANGNEKKYWVAILMSEKMNFKTKTITRNKEDIT